MQRKMTAGPQRSASSVWLMGLVGSATLSLAGLGCDATADSEGASRAFAGSYDESEAVVARDTCSENPALVGCQPPSSSGAAPPGALLESPPAQEPSAGDQYTAAGTQPFVMVAHDPLSTFAVDVDTASYDVFRRDVEDGRLPAPASVRVEEYVNYFAYDYPAAADTAEVPFSISLAAAPSVLGPERTLLRVGIQGKQPPPASEKRPTNLVYLVDVSGSMSTSDRLPLAQQVLSQSLDLLDGTDTVSIVTYASDTGVRLAPTKVSERELIVREIAGLAASGSTAGASGIQLAYAQAEAAFIEGGVNHVVLCTDGDFNVGVSSTTELLALIKEKRQTGVTFTALGFGTGNLNDGMLEAISNAGNGFYGVISSEGQAAKYVDERLLSTLSLIARDMKVQVEFNPELIEAYRLLGYENRAIADRDFENDIIDAGEIGAGHRVTALYELVLAGAALPDLEGAPLPTNGAAYSGVREVASGDLVQVEVRYKTVDASSEDPALEVSASLAASAQATSLTAADADLAWAISVAGFAEILKGSPYAGSADLGVLEAVFAEQSERDADRAEFYQLFERARGMF